jgi:hypothetical protein
MMPRLRETFRKRSGSLAATFRSDWESKSADGLTVEPISPKGTMMKLTHMKRTALAGAAALTLVGASLGVVAAQDAPAASPAPAAPGAPRHGAPGQQQGDRQQGQQQFIAALAARLGISTDQLQQAMDQTRADLGIPERGPGAGDQGMPGRGPRGGEQGMPGRGPGGGDQGMQGRGPGGRLDAAAQALGITVDQLRQELQGQSLTQVAQAHGVDPTTVATALKQAASTHIDQEAAAGRLPADQVATAKQQAEQRVDQMMAQTAPAGREARTEGHSRSR